MDKGSCRVIIGLSGETLTPSTMRNICLLMNQKPSDVDDQLLTKIRVTLPKSVDQWKAANNYFQASLPNHDIASSGLTTKINCTNKIIYEHSKINFGLVISIKTNEINTKYKDCSKHGLKSCLKQLKKDGADSAEIKVAAHLLRCKLNSSKLYLNEGQADQQIKRNFWGFVKTIFEKTISTLPSFDGAACTTFFAKTFSSITPFKSFEIPDWIPTLTAPNIEFILSLPSYKQINNVVRKIKSSGSEASGFGLLYMLRYIAEQSFNNLFSC